MTIRERVFEALSHPLRVVQKGAHDELMGGEGDG